jgi:hypothetical protein
MILAPTSTDHNRTSDTGIQLIAGPRKGTWTIVYPTGKTVNVLASREILHAQAKLAEIVTAMKSGWLIPPDPSNPRFRAARTELRDAIRRCWEAHGLAVGPDNKPVVLSYHPAHEPYLYAAAA